MLGFMITPYLLHFFLRSYGKWNPVFCKTHVYGSIGLQILVFIFSVDYSSISKSPKQYYYFSSLDSFQNSNALLTIFFLLFLLLQILFLIYFFIRVFQKAK